MQNLTHTRRDNKFDEARACLEQLILGLSTRFLVPQTEGDVEQLVAAKGNEVLRLVLQGWLDERSKKAFAREAAHAPVPGIHARPSTRTIESLFGRVSYARPGRKKVGEACRLALDRELNLPPEPYSLAVRARVAHEVSRTSFDDALDALARTTGAHVPKRQAEQLAVRSAQDFDAFYQRTHVGNDNRLHVPRALLVATCDSKGIRMINRDLRLDTRGRKLDRTRPGTPKGDPFKQKQGHTHDKRMVVVTAVYETMPRRRSATTIARGLRGLPHASRKPASRVWDKHLEATVTHAQAVAIGSMWDEVDRRDPSRRRHTVVLLDGEEKQIWQAKKQARERGRPITIVLDLMHGLHYVWGACQALTSPRDAHRAVHTEQLVDTMMHRLLTTSADAVADALEQRAQGMKLNSTNRHALAKGCAYLRKHSAYMNYRLYLARGYPIATGVVEGACRHLVQDRLGITGARWGLATAEAILKLRALRTNGDWDAYWAFHETREHARNYRNAA